MRILLQLDAHIFLEPTLSTAPRDNSCQTAFPLKEWKTRVPTSHLSSWSSVNMDKKTLLSQRFPRGRGVGVPRALPNSLSSRPLNYQSTRSRQHQRGLCEGHTTGNASRKTFVHEFLSPDQVTSVYDVIGQIPSVHISVIRTAAPQTNVTLMKFTLSESTSPQLLRSREQNKSGMNSIILHVVFVLSAMTIAYATDSEAIGYFLRHPQEQFCAADFGKSWEQIVFALLITVWWLNLWSVKALHFLQKLGKRLTVVLV